ncbi:MAG: DUF4340 domain-containing protein [Deltaproteobacteria bacterium]|nr:DUF4340 domain-containing protein [Deltaproteobacteria bacterium]MBW1987404.1 DUF4340 domain-containing protein [Deltaproteobacteria bacterium]
MSIKKLLPYLVVLLVVAGGFFISEHYQSQKEAEEKAAKKVFAVPADKITAITLKRDGREIKLTKNKKWQIIQPLPTPADDFAVNSLRDTLAGLEKQREIEVEPEKLVDYGLDHPDLIVDFAADPKTYQLRIGHKVPGGRGYYAQPDATGKVLLISAIDKEALDKNLTALRDKTVFTISPEKANALEVRTAKVDLTLKKTSPETWVWEDHPQTRIRTDRVESLLRQLRNLRAQEFVSEKPENLEIYGLAPVPAARITVSQDKQKETLLLGAKKGKLCYAHKTGRLPIFQVDRELLEGLPTSASQLEDRRLWRGKEAEVEKMNWGPPDQQVKATKEKDDWRLTFPDGRVEKKPAMRLGRVLWRLKELEYERLVPSTNPSPKDPKFSLQLIGSQDKPLLKLETFDAKEPDLLRVRSIQGEQTLDALVSKKSLAAWRQELGNLLTTASPGPTSK